MPKTIGLRITTPTGAATQAIMQTAPDSSGSFAQLLALFLTDTGGDLDTPVREPVVHEMDCQSATRNEPAAIAPTVLPITLPPVLPFAESKETTPTRLGGGKWGAGDTAPIAPAPLPLFLPNRQEINRLNTDWQESDICQDIQSIIQENSQKLYSSDIERVASLLGDEHGRIQEITNNLYFMQSGSDMPEHQGAVDGGKSLSEPASFPSKRVEALHPPRSAVDTSPDHPLPFPALHFTPIDATNASPAGSATISSPQPHEQIAQLIEHLVLHREESAVHLRLDPPELGTVEIRIQVDGNAVHAWLAAERDLTRQSLEQQAQQLREQLAARGLHLAHFEVNAGMREAFAQARYMPPPSLPSSESPSRPRAAMESAYLFGQWSVWA
jgi:hypothetical protein